MQALNYEQLLSDYNDALNTKLRGFRPVEEYLDIWVPDNDHAKSILNLVEAAEMAGKSEVSIELGDATLMQMDLTKLEALLKKMSTAVQISKQKSANAPVVIQVTLAKQGVPDKTSSSPASTDAGPSSYRFSLSARLGALSFQHEGTLASAPAGTTNFKASNSDSTLEVSVENESHKILAAKYKSATTPEAKALLELFCEIIEGLPIQEASDHGVMKLEYMLRDTARKAPVGGVLTPWNADPMFKPLMSLIRQINTDYKIKLNIKEGVNFFDKAPSKEWLALNEEEKKARAQNFIDNFLKNSPWSHTAVRVSSLQGQGDTRIFCHVEGQLAPQQEPEMLMKLELEMRQNVENRIEIFLEEKKDLNSKRRL